MNIGITGATGFVGKHVAAAARARGHRVIAFSRRPRPDPAFDEVRSLADLQTSDFSAVDAVVHLAGEPVFGPGPGPKRTPSAAAGSTAPAIW